MPPLSPDYSFALKHKKRKRFCSFLSFLCLFVAPYLILKTSHSDSSLKTGSRNLVR